jgi:hypothetical protein
MIEVLIVGFGFSAVPLVRELEATHTPFKIISGEASSVWDGLSKSERLDFDLVSSYLTSFFSFDLAEAFEKDYYPTASEFYEMHKRWRKKYAERIVNDIVVRVDNFQDHSVVHTRSGQVLKARHLVFSTAFSRTILSDLQTMNYNAPNQTFVFDTMGDSANLMISKLIPYNVKIIIRTNGFHARDKVVPVSGTSYTLDQLEFHNFRYVSHDIYSSIIYGVTPGSGNPILLGDQFPTTRRDTSHVLSKSRPASGAVAIKYWPVDQYFRNFGDDLETAITNGYALNDIAMWLHTGRAIVVPKDAPIDLEKKTITYAGIERSFDRYVKADAEAPRLPPIMIDGATTYQYLHRDNFMGVIPKTLNNIYMMGYTRPYTGGLANIVEMQCLFVHKLVTQPDFHRRIHRNLTERIDSYNEHYYGAVPACNYDHLVYFGFYTDDMARLMGIDFKPADCATLKDLLFYYAFPNNAFKYRLKGEYAVPRVEQLIEKVNQKFNYFILSFAYLSRSSTMNAADREQWLHLARRNFFNDMRHKEEYRPFVEQYIQTYRRINKTTIEDVEDPEWDALVSEACATRDREIPNIRKISHYQLDEDIADEVELILSWLTAGHRLDDLSKWKLDPQRAELISALLNPPEYDLPYLRS